MADEDPTVTDPDKYRTIFENDVVRVLEYVDSPGAMTSPHRHPDSVMYTLSSFSRRLHVGGMTRDVELEAGQAHWLPAQVHAGENIGSSETHVVFVELKTADAPPGDTLGPEVSEHGAGVEQA
jgi:beta-alanine degradation protein BauB